MLIGIEKKVSLRNSSVVFQCLCSRLLHFARKTVQFVGIRVKEKNTHFFWEPLLARVFIYILRKSPMIRIMYINTVCFIAEVGLFIKICSVELNLARNAFQFSSNFVKHRRGRLYGSVTITTCTPTIAIYAPHIFKYWHAVVTEVFIGLLTRLVFSRVGVFWNCLLLINFAIGGFLLHSTISVSFFVFRFKIF